VDEIKPFVAGGNKYLAVKSVCTNFTALPILYSPVGFVWLASKTHIFSEREGDFKK
jgi:hypothetical protein